MIYAEEQPSRHVCQGDHQLAKPTGNHYSRHVRLSAVVMLAGMLLAFVPGFGDLVIHCLHADESHESTDHFCDGHCHDCSPHSQNPALMADNLTTTQVTSARAIWFSAPTLSARAGFSSLLERPPAS